MSNPPFLNVISVTEAVRRLTALPSLTHRAETVPLAAMDNRVLASSVTARCTVPPAHRAGMDGYAVQAADTFGAGEGNPVWLDCVGHVVIDAPADFSLSAGQCAGVVTGAHMPEGADAVMMVEYTREFGADVIEMRRSVAPGEYVMLQGEDAAAGQVALAAGTLLRPQEVGLLAAIGETEATVYPRPRVHILSTGDELVPVEALPRSGQIRDVNTHALAFMVRQAGACPESRGIAPDNLEALRGALVDSLAEKPDVILLSGGSSVGVRDLTLAALDSLPFACNVFCHGVALSPGKPLILADVRQKDGHRTIVWGLPGQVASAQVVMMVLGAPFLRHLAGHADAFNQQLWPLRRAVLTRNTASRQGREDYVRVRLDFSQDQILPMAVPVPGLSGLLRTLLGAHGLMRIPAEAEGLEAGAEVDVLLFS